MIDPIPDKIVGPIVADVLTHPLDEGEAVEADGPFFDSTLVRFDNTNVTWDSV